jgi:hypothetical protein
MKQENRKKLFIDSLKNKRLYDYEECINEVKTQAELKEKLEERELLFRYRKV